MIRTYRSWRDVIYCRNDNSIENVISPKYAKTQRKEPTGNKLTWSTNFPEIIYAIWVRQRTDIAAESARLQVINLAFCQYRTITYSLNKDGQKLTGLGLGAGTAGGAHLGCDRSIQLWSQGVSIWKFQPEWAPPAVSGPNSSSERKDFRTWKVQLKLVTAVSEGFGYLRSIVKSLYYTIVDDCVPYQPQFITPVHAKVMRYELPVHPLNNCLSHQCSKLLNRLRIRHSYHNLTYPFRHSKCSLITHPGQPACHPWRGVCLMGGRSSRMTTSGEPR